MQETGSVRASEDCLRVEGERRVVSRSAVAYTECSGKNLAPEISRPEEPWERGFSQAELLAGVISWKLGIPKASLLERGRPTAQQSRKSRRDRQVSLQRAFRLSPEGRRLSLAGKKIFLVDDVYTTGTTLKDCAEPLRRAGAGPVLAVTFAR
jgi:competence protein ComFC